MSISTLSRKALLKDHHTVAKKWLQENTESTVCATVESLSNELASLIAKKLTIDDHQNALKGAIGRAKSAGKSTDDLIKEMRSTASQAKTFNASINSAADSLLEILKSAEDIAVNDFSLSAGPGQFQAPSWLGTQQLERDGVQAVNTTLIDDVTSSAEVWQADQQRVTDTRSRVVEAGSGELWDEYINAHPGATHYHQYAWRGVIERNFKQKYWYVNVLDSAGRISGVFESGAYEKPNIWQFSALDAVADIRWIAYKRCTVIRGVSGSCEETGW